MSLLLHLFLETSARFMSLMKNGCQISAIGSEKEMYINLYVKMLAHKKLLGVNAMFM